MNLKGKGPGARYDFSLDVCLKPLSDPVESQVVCLFKVAAQFAKNPQSPFGVGPMAKKKSEIQEHVNIPGLNRPRHRKHEVDNLESGREP